MKIISKEVIADYSGVRIVKLVLLSVQISQKAKAGQFVVLMFSAHGERIPLTIVEADTSAGTISLIFQEAGLTTKLLGQLKAGDSLYALAGPLGRPTEIKNYGKVILIGGGVGIAEIYPVAKSLREAANNVTVIIGSRNKKLLILEEELRIAADEFFVVSDDGSSGVKGFTTDILQGLLKKDKYDFVYAVGPMPMMEKVSFITRPFNISTVVSLNTLMVDATGMCGCCRVSVGGKVKFSCIDGPEFDAHQIDWDELKKRNSMYLEKEKHICNLQLKENA